MRFFRKKLKRQPDPLLSQRVSPPGLGRDVTARPWGSSVAASKAQVTHVDGYEFDIHAAGVILHPEQRVEISWVDNEVVHVIQAEVDTQDGSTYRLTSANIAQEMPQLRSAERVTWNRDARIEIISSRVKVESSIAQVQTIDISSGGVKFATSLPLAPGDTVRLTVDGYEPMTAEVLRSSNLARAWRHNVSAKWLHPVKMQADC